MTSLAFHGVMRTHLATLLLFDFFLERLVCIIIFFYSFLFRACLVQLVSYSQSVFRQFVSRTSCPLTVHLECSYGEAEGINYRNLI